MASLLQDPYYQFWEEYIKEAVRVASKIEGVTDTYLRQKACAYRTLFKLENDRLKTLISHHNTNANAIRNLDLHSELRQEFERIVNRIRKFKALSESFIDILYARLALKDEYGIVRYFLNITVPEEAQYWTKKMKDQFPS